MASVKADHPAVELDKEYKPSEFLRLLNSTEIGQVCASYTWSKHRTAAGNRIGTGSNINPVKFAAWYAYQRHGIPPKSDYDKAITNREAANRAGRRLNEAAREIGPDLPECKHPEEKERAKHDFKYFCERYFKLLFYLPWSDDHLRVMAKLELAVRGGGLFAMAMPRASGKSALCIIATIWATMNGHHKYVALIGADEDKAQKSLESIKMLIETSTLLAEDYPEVSYPVKALDRIARRAIGQTFRGEPTYIVWSATEIVYPMIPVEGADQASGAVIQIAGITGAVRGMSYNRPDGQMVRPSLVIVDDPQTDGSAKSITQCMDRELILSGAILGLAGPGKKISGIMPCTVIRKNDLADTMLDRQKHPQWNGERTKMVYQWPTHEKMWDRYKELRAESFRLYGDGRLGNEFYSENRDIMDEGAVVAWEARFNDDEFSAIHCAWNLRIQDEQAFFAEYQNDPIPAMLDPNALHIMTADEICEKINRTPQGVVPAECQELTAFIDPKQDVLWWAVVGWTDRFDGHVVAYGVYPDQGQKYVTTANVQQTLSMMHPNAGMEGALHAGLEKLTDALIGKDWKRSGEDSGSMQIGRCLVDANWGVATDLLYRFCQHSKHSSVLMPSHGRYYGATSFRTLAETQIKEGDKRGLHWLRTLGQRGRRHVVFDSNFWKSFIHARLAVQPGDPGCLQLYGSDQRAHRMVADHLTAEQCIRVSAKGRTVDEWKERADRPDNDLLDCFVGCAVAASMQGITLKEFERAKTQKTKRVMKMSELQQQARMGRPATK